MTPGAGVRRRGGITQHWATGHIAALRRGETVVFRPTGNSMAPRVESGQLCTVVPITEPPRVGDIVLCRVKGRDYLHLVQAVHGIRYLIGNNRGHSNGWITPITIFGRLVVP